MGYDKYNEHRIKVDQVNPQPEPGVYRGNQDASAEQHALDGYITKAVADPTSYYPKERPVTYNNADDENGPYAGLIGG